MFKYLHTNGLSVVEVGRETELMSSPGRKEMMFMEFFNFVNIILLIIKTLIELYKTSKK